MTSLALLVGRAPGRAAAVVAAADRPGGHPGTRCSWASIAISMAAIYLLTLLCGWYPSRLATKVQPAEALHYE